MSGSLGSGTLGLLAPRDDTPVITFMAEIQSDLLVLGGGVAGLAAAAELARRGFSVTLLEARDRLGGRICTTRPQRGAAPVELGAEFIHAGNPALWRFLKKHRVAAKHLPGGHWRFAGGRMWQIEDAAAELEVVTQRIDPKRMPGWSFAKFLRQHRHRFTADQCAFATEFVEGFEGAPPEEMSATAMQGESFDTSEQFALPGGYDQLVNALAADARRAGATIALGCVVRSIAWRPGCVTVHSRKNTWQAKAAVIALPIGVLQAAARQRGAVAFRPALREKQKLISRMRMGHVIRLTLRFEPRAWRSLLPKSLRPARNGFGFIHSGIAGVPVWWSLSRRPMLTGWVGGPAAGALARQSEHGILQKALASLAEIFGQPKSRLRAALADFATHNWSRDPFTRGAYSFTVAGQEGASAKLREPVARTLFFAGEATADGAEVGTVHGALASGLRAAHEVRTALR